MRKSKSSCQRNKRVGPYREKRLLEKHPSEQREDRTAQRHELVLSCSDKFAKARVFPQRADVLD